MFRLENLVYEYAGGRRALDGVSLQVPKGQWLAVLGANGSGKSTLARHLNGLLQPTAGRVLVAGRPLEEYTDIQQLRRLVGIVFQNPDNQIVGNSVEEDVAFGLENLGLPRPEMRRRIGEALQMVGLAGRDLHLPPGGGGDAGGLDRPLGLWEHVCRVQPDDERLWYGRRLGL